jgi:hypothetical protein
MAKEPEFGMDKAELKTLLLKSKQEPVSCALGKGKEASAAYILLHKTKAPLALETELGKKFADLRDGRRGSASVDPDVDPKLVNFRINKPASGLAPRVAKLLKTVGFAKVRFEFEDGSAPETHGSDDENEVAPAAAPADAAPTYDADAIKHRLALLVQQMIKAIGADPSRKDALSAMARQANAALTSGGLPEASLQCDELESALAQPVAQAAAPGVPVPDAPAAPTPEAVAVAKSRQAWLAVHRKVATDIETLRRSILEEYQDTALVAQLDQRFGEVVAPVLTHLDAALATALDEIGTARDAGERVRLVERAHELMRGYESYVASEPLLADLDSNPFVPMAIAKTVTATLRTLAVAVK